MTDYSFLANAHAGDLLASGAIDLDDPDDDWCLGNPYDPRYERETEEWNKRVDALIEEAAEWELKYGPIEVVNF